MDADSYCEINTATVLILLAAVMEKVQRLVTSGGMYMLI
jgi:hypothetical protein